MPTRSPQISTNIIAARDLSIRERQSLDEWFRQEFGHIPYEWAEPEWYAIAHTRDDVIGHLTILRRRVSVAGQPLWVGGIGGVITRAEYRGRGVATALLMHAADFLKESLEVEFGLLLCRHEVAPVYQKVGWVTVAGPTSFAQSSGLHTYPRETMILPCLLGREWPEGQIDLCGLPW